MVGSSEIRATPQIAGIELDQMDWNFVIAAFYSVSARKPRRDRAEIETCPSFGPLAILAAASL